MVFLPHAIFGTNTENTEVLTHFDSASGLGPSRAPLLTTSQIQRSHNDNEMILSEVGTSPSSGYFATGMTDEIAASYCNPEAVSITSSRLSQIKALHILERSSSLAV